jgi:AcrR family transcriptional regulator
MAQPVSRSPRRDELLEAAYRHVLGHGLGAMSLRPLAAAIGTSPRVLLFLFGSKEQLVRDLLARARAEELVLVEDQHEARAGLAELGSRLWDWMCREENRALLELWVEAYGRSLTDPTGPWAGFARATVTDWLAILARADDADEVATTAVLALLRGALLDLLATGDLERTTRAVRSQLAHVS